MGIDVLRGLAVRSRQNLSGYANVTVQRDGDGATFDPGPRSGMLINAGVTHPLPLGLDRLSEGGRLVLPLTARTTAALGVGFVTKIVRQGACFPPRL